MTERLPTKGTGYSCRKHYGHEQGLSCVFRQHGAKSHCAKLHGYALAFSFEFAAVELDTNGWVLDFGSLKPLKAWLTETFDHTTLVAEDDGMRHHFEVLADQGLVTLHVVPRVGCEAFARAAFERVNAMVLEATGGRVWCTSATVAEHGGNSASYSL